MKKDLISVVNNGLPVTGGSWAKSPIKITDIPPKGMLEFVDFIYLSLLSIWYSMNNPTMDFSSITKSLQFLNTLCKAFSAS